MPRRRRPGCRGDCWRTPASRASPLVAISALSRRSSSATTRSSTATAGRSSGIPTTPRMRCRPRWRARSTPFPARSAESSSVHGSTGWRTTRRSRSCASAPRPPTRTVRQSRPPPEPTWRPRPGASALVVADLDRLPDRQRGALVMRELSGLDYAEIGAALAVSPAAARQAVYEARVALRDVSRGREMDCEAARRAVSEGDGRRLRSRRLRAHLRACDSCSDFSAAISQRRSDLRALCPPLSAIAASGLMTAVLGGTGKGGLGAAASGLAGGTGGVAAGGVTGGMVAKGASLAAAIAIGAGAAGMSGVVRMPVLDRNGPAVEQGLPPAPARGLDHAGLGSGRAGGSRARSVLSGRASVELDHAARPGTARTSQAGRVEAPVRWDGLIALKGMACRRPRTEFHLPTLPRGATRTATAAPRGAPPARVKPRRVTAVRAPETAQRLRAAVARTLAAAEPPPVTAPHRASEIAQRPRAAARP